METIRIRSRRLVPIALTAFLVAACSSGGPAAQGAGDPPRTADSDEPLALVLAASDHALEADSMHMTFELTVEAAGEEIRGSGEADASFDGEPRQHMTFRYDSLPGLPDGVEMEMIVDGSTMFMRVEGMDGLGAFPTEWVSVDLSEAVPGFEDLMALGGGRSDPSNAFGYLQGAEEASELGTETIGGIDTTHYEVTVDVADAVAEVPADLRREMRLVLRQFRAQFGTTTMPFEVWVDADGMLRRLRYRMESDINPAGAFSMEMTMDVTEYGNDFELQRPPPATVTDLTEMVGLPATRP